MKKFLLPILVIYIFIGCKENKNIVLPDVSTEVETPNIILLMADDQG